MFEATMKTWRHIVSKQSPMATRKNSEFFTKGETDTSLIKHMFNLHNNLHNIISSVETCMTAINGCQSMAKYLWLTTSHIPVTVTTPNVHQYRQYPYDGTVNMAGMVYG